MGYFEQQPWLLILVIILTVEAWSALKGLVKRSLLQRGPRMRR